MFKTLRSRFLVGFTFLVILVVAAAEISFIKANELVSAAFAARLNAAEASFHAAMEQESLRALSMAEIVARDPGIIDAFAAGDRTQLQQRLGASFAELKSKHGIEQAHFHLPPATSFLRLFKPDTFGDDMSSTRRAVVVANQTRQPVRGIEIGQGGLGFRAIVPVSKDGRHIGTFEYGAAFGDVMVKKLAAAMQANAGIYLARDGQFDVLGTTFPAGFKPAREVLAASLREAQFEPNVAVGNATLALRFVPIRDFAGKSVAVAVFGIDRHRFEEMVKSNLTRIGSVTLVVLLLLGGMALAFLLGVARPVTNLVDDMRRLADGDLKGTTAGTRRNDEIGDMSRAVEVFRTNAISHLALERALDREHRESRLRQERIEQLASEFLSDAEKALTLLASNGSVGAAAPAGKSPVSAPQVPEAGGLVNKAAQDLKSRVERFLSEVKAT
jgi:methyl-accepting chemotaxis protein